MQLGHGCYDVAKGGTVKVSLAVGKSYKRNDIPFPNEFDHTTRRCVLEHFK
jgi:hypothetical protein